MPQASLLTRLLPGASPSVGTGPAQAQFQVPVPVRRHSQITSRGARCQSQYPSLYTRYINNSLSFSAELARHLQAEEEHYAREREARFRQQERERRVDLDRQRREEEERRQKELYARRANERRAGEGEGKKRECVIM